MSRDISLRPTGIGRYIVAALLLAWLAGWAAGEGFALFAAGGIVKKLVGAGRQQVTGLMEGDPASAGAVAFIVVFLTIWLTIWTIGGIAAMTHLVRLLWGEDTIALTESGFEVVRRGGPFSRRLE